MQRHCAASYGEPLQLAEIRNPEMETWLAEAGNQLVAYAQLRRGAAPVAVTARRPIEIQRFYGHAGAHGQGVARALMEHALERAVQLESDVVWLGVWELNPRAIAFYRKWGFEVAGPAAGRSMRYRWVITVNGVRTASRQPCVRPLTNRHPR